jgi:taurine transport system substrate-binding protein
MKKRYKQISAALLTTVITGSVMAKDELNIAYFLEWPSANQVAQVEKTYDEKMGMKVNWRSFDDGNAMTAAMVSGDIDIAYSQGFIPFVIGVTKGIDLKLIGVAMTYADNDNCVVHKDAKITKDNAKDLEGKKVATLTSGVSYYKMLKTLEHLKVDVKKVKVLSMSNADAAAALARGDVDMACGFGGALNRMKEYGNVLMTGAEQEVIGLKVFDIVATTGKFAKEHPKLVTQFMQITEDANLAYNKDPAKYYKTLAKASGMKEEGAIKTLNKFTFLDKSTQLSKDWMQGGVQSFTKEVADFFVKQKELPKALSQEAYNKTIDTSFLENVK